MVTKPIKASKAHQLTCVYLICVIRTKTKENNSLFTGRDGLNYLPEQLSDPRQLVHPV